MTSIERLLPHRPPFLMVKSIVEYVGGDAPILNAEYPVRLSDPLPSFLEPPLCWPSVYIIEGLGQCCSLLSLIGASERDCREKGAKGAYTLEQSLEIFERSARNAASRIGMLASVDVEILGQVQSGELLQYRVEQTHVLESLIRFAVQACVETQVVAHGTIVGARLRSNL